MDPELLEEKEKKPKLTRPERIAALTELLELKKLEFAELSKEIFQINQEFNTQSEDAKRAKSSVNKLMKEYVATNTEVALREAELALKQELLKQKIEVETDITNDRQGDIEQARNELNRILSVYSECRKNLEIFQDNVTQETDNARMAALNHVAFLKYSQSLIMQQIHKVSDQSYFPTKKESGIIRDECLRHLDRSTKTLKRLYREKLVEFRRHERILTGRRAELIEQEKMKDMKVYETLDQQLKSTLTGNPMFEFDTSDEPAPLPELPFRSSAPAGGNRKGSSSAARRKFKGAVHVVSASLPSMSLSYAGGSLVEGSKRLNTPSASASIVQQQQQQLQQQSQQSELIHSHVRHASNMLYDFSKYEHFSHPENMKVGTLLSTIHDATDKKSVASTKQLQQYLMDNDEYLVNLALTLAAIEGKQKELTAIKEGLDIQLVKQAHMVLNMTADMYRRVGLPLPNPLKAPNVTLAHTSGGHSVPAAVLSASGVPVPSPGRSVEEILKDREKAEYMSGAIAGQYRFAFDPYLDLAGCQKDIEVHEQLIGELNYQTKALLRL